MYPDIDMIGNKVLEFFSVSILIKSLLQTKISWSGFSNSHLIWTMSLLNIFLHKNKPTCCQRGIISLKSDDNLYGRPHTGAQLASALAPACAARACAALTPTRPHPPASPASTCPSSGAGRREAQRGAARQYRRCAATPGWPLRPGELIQGKTSSGQGLVFFKPLRTPEN
jgi:hypothetical protein